jgi:hypothetical protein
MTPVRAAAAAVFQYEAVAIATGQLPTITHLCARHRPGAAVTVAALLVHLYLSDRTFRRKVNETAAEAIGVAT